MNSASNPSILPLNKKSKSTKDSFFDPEKFKEDIKIEITEHLEGNATIKKLFELELQKIEQEFTDEIKKIHDIFKNLGSELDKNKNQIFELIQVQVKEDLNNVQKLCNQHDKQLAQLISTSKDTTTTSKNIEIRNELAMGIRMLGERVSKAIEEMDKRFLAFKDEMQADANNELDYLNSEVANSETGNLEFGTIKESKLLNTNEFEIVPKETVKNLMLLFKKHSQNVRIFVQEQETKLISLQQLLDYNDGEYKRLIELHKKRTTKYFYFTASAIGILAVLFIIFQFLV